MADVVLVRWPEEGPEGVRLASEGVPVLYLVGPHDDPPAPATCLEDWVRLPSDDRDMRARVIALESRAAQHAASPTVDDEGRLHYHGRSLPLSSVEARLAHVLADHFGELVPDKALIAAASPDELASERSLRREIAELRARLRVAGLAIARVRGRGYKLHDATG
jgi:DNA-binding response OmpR family regulator